MVGKRIDEFAGECVDRLQRSALRHKKAPVFPVFALPIVCAALSCEAATSTCGGGEGMNPSLFTGSGIECDQRALLRSYVGDVVDYQGTEAVCGGITCIVGPGDIQFIHVGLIDLLQRGIMRTVWSSEMIFP